MYHRKENHQSNKICRNSLNCEFVNTQKGCWYKHTTINTVGVLTPAIIASWENCFNCKTCNNEFPSRNDLMQHRKRYHPGNACQRKNYILGNCRKDDDDCWYHHGQLPTTAHRVVRQTIPNISSRQDFPEVPVLDQRNQWTGQHTQTKQLLIMLQQQQQNQNKQMEIVMNQLAQLMK